jgi:hypothetical protein
MEYLVALALVEGAGPHLLELLGVDAGRVGVGNHEAVVRVERQAGVRKVGAAGPEHGSVNHQELVVLNLAEGGIGDDRDACVDEGLVAGGVLWSPLRRRLRP